MRSENETAGRQRSFIELARRRQIIASAVEVMAEVGYANASLARIAEHAGTSKGVISYHFAGKDELMTELVIQLFVAAGEYMVPLIEAAPDAPSRLRTYIDANLAYVDANRTYINALVAVVANLRKPDGGLVFDGANEERDLIEPLAGLLHEGQKSGDFGEFDARQMARSIRDAIDGAGGRAARDPDFDMVGYADHLCRIFDLATRGVREESTL
ncbi:TetR/AcrR family transcriptional regulator [Nocardia panacis]|uniref:TetR/AcrR family transcriptional regulator n=1 Tax=Nocardia panacis TaxID=2340916 RepID=A0A3A4JRB8_9NOCA|nr:TetR/AcrR family transcriptional regulator [Nocardia panacis]RJO68191.1 TetR/AcrR family transcriptional regulator [Nocardia panacis]